MMFILIGIVLWVVMGTAVFRRTGHAAVTATKDANEWRNKYRKMVGDHHGSLCYMSGRWPALQYRGCNCSLRHEALSRVPSAAAGTYIGWPVIIVWWGIYNACKAYANFKGEDYNFFVPAKMVKSKDERIAELNAKIQELESNNDIKVDE